ncbi:MAG: carboxypeptidase regulatory-like domain-containing protein, partial [Alistipes sp.]|nr:carboxypeptidase regulatory-like domain-containing protein [Alistipes sp.]
MTIFGANAQNFIRGRVVEANNSAAIGYATIALLSDSTIIRAAAAREDGCFSIEFSEKGPLKVEVSAVGYTTTIKDIVGKGENIDLGDIVLSQGVAVDAVNITIQRPIVTADAEKLTYSVEDDPEAATSTLEDMIRKVPQLSLDAEGKVLMNGQSDYKILINGRNSSSISRNFADVIKSMPAASIKRIEVITNPSMKYDAEGTGGVLNIITAKSRFDGYNGRVSLMASNWFNRNFSTNNSAMATLQHNKFSVSASFYYSQAWATDDNVGNQYTKIENLVSGNPTPLTTTDIDYGYRYYSIYGNLNASYQINDRNFVTAEFGIWDGSNKTFMKEQYSYFDAMHNPLFSQRVEQNIHYPSWLGIDATVSYEHSFKKEGHSLTISDN